MKSFLSIDEWKVLIVVKDYRCPRAHIFLLKHGSRCEFKNSSDSDRPLNIYSHPMQSETLQGDSNMISDVDSVIMIVHGGISNIDRGGLGKTPTRYLSFDKKEKEKKRATFLWDESNNCKCGRREPLATSR